MITVKNHGHETLRVTHTADPTWLEEVKPQATVQFSSFFFDGHFCVEPMRRRVRDARFDPRGGDPYNRTGSRAVP